MANLWHHLHRWCMVAMLGALALTATAQTPQAVPALTARVIDNTGSLTPEQRQVLDNKLALFEKSDGTQIVVLMVPSTSPEDIESYANRVGNTWKIGRKEVGDGLLIVVAKNDRRMRIEVAKALEGAVPDVAAKHVIDEAITPRFKQQDFAGGINAGIDRLVELVQKEKLPAPTNTDPGGGWSETAKTLGGWYLVAEILLTLTLTIGGFLMGLFMAAVGATTAALSSWILGNDSVTVGAGLLGYLLGGYMVVRWANGQSVTATTVATPKPPPPKPLASATKSEPWWSGWSSGSGSDSGSSSFSSGGGGDFGGGGASGSW